MRRLIIHPESSSLNFCILPQSEDCNRRHIPFQFQLKVAEGNRAAAVQLYLKANQPAQALRRDINYKTQSKSNGLWMKIMTNSLTNLLTLPMNHFRKI